MTEQNWKAFPPKMNRKGYLKKLAAALDAGLDINIRDPNRSQTTLLMQAAQNNQHTIVEFLIEKGADVNLQDETGDTALIFSVLEMHTDLVKLLLASGADPNIFGRFGNTALISAASNSETPLELFQILIKAGADVNANSQNKFGQTALMRFVSNFSKTMKDRVSYNKITQTLIEASPNLDVVDKEQKTALMYAVRDGDIDLVKKLLIVGVTIDLKNMRGQTATDIAKEWECFEIFEILKKTEKLQNLKKEYNKVRATFRAQREAYPRRALKRRVSK